MIYSTSTPRPAHVLVDPITDKEFVLEDSHLIHELVPGGYKLINRLIASGFTLEDYYWEQMEDANLLEKSSPQGCASNKVALIMAPPSLSLFPGCHWACCSSPLITLHEAIHRKRFSSWKVVRFHIIVLCVWGCSCEFSSSFSEFGCFYLTGLCWINLSHQG